MLHRDVQSPKVKHFLNESESLFYADLQYSLDLHTDAVCSDCLAPAVKDWGEKST